MGCTVNSKVLSSSDIANRTAFVSSFFLYNFRCVFSSSQSIGWGKRRNSMQVWVRPHDTRIGQHFCSRLYVITLNNIIEVCDALLYIVSLRHSCLSSNININVTSTNTSTGVRLARIGHKHCVNQRHHRQHYSPDCRRSADCGHCRCKWRSGNCTY